MAAKKFAAMNNKRSAGLTESVLKRESTQSQQFPMWRNLITGLKQNCFQCQLQYPAWCVHYCAIPVDIHVDSNGIKKMNVMVNKVVPIGAESLYNFDGFQPPPLPGQMPSVNPLSPIGAVKPDF